MLWAWKIWLQEDPSAGPADRHFSDELGVCEFWQQALARPSADANMAQCVIWNEFQQKQGQQGTGNGLAVFALHASKENRIFASHHMAIAPPWRGTVSGVSATVTIRARPMCVGTIHEPFWMRTYQQLDGHLD